MTALADWKKAKTAFESATKQKKPSAKFMGVFNKSSGMESACKGLDDAAKKNDEQKMLKAEAAYDKAMTAYNKTLNAALQSDKGAGYKSAVTTLQTKMGTILEGFVKARNDARRELFKKLQRDSENMLKEMDRRFKVCQQDEKLAEGQASDCDSALREVIDHCAKHNERAAKESAKKVGIASKALVDIHKRVVKQQAQMQEYYTKTRKGWQDDAAKFTGSESPVRTNDDKSDAYNFAVDTIVQKLDELANEGKQAGEDCKKALKGNLDETAVYITSGERLQKRAINSVATFDSTYRDIGGEIDKASQDRMNGDESSDEQLKKRLYTQARGKLNSQKNRIRDLATELKRSKQDIQRQLKGFPATIQSHNDFKPILDDINKAIGFIDEIEEGLKKEATKLNKEEAKIPK